MSNWREYAKALVGAAIAVITTAIPLVTDGVSLVDILTMVLAGLAAFSGVYLTPNRDEVTPDV